MRVLVTRPEREAQRWVHELRQRGLDADALPLIAIGPPPDEQPVRQAWQQLDGYHAVMFVSGNAVTQFFRLQPAASQWPLSVRTWAPGPGTRDALLTAGVPRGCIDEPAQDAGQFDSEALWAQVSDQLRPGQRVLLVRGGDAQGRGAGREWLAEQLTVRGLEVDSVVSYVRRAPEWTPAEYALAGHGSRDGSIWLFSSSEAILHLRSLLPCEPWDLARAVVTHPRIAEAARAAGFGVVCLSRPTLPDVVASIESIR